MGTAIIYEDNEKQISLIAETLDEDVVFMTETDGRISHFDNYNDALIEYIKLTINKESD